MAAMARLNRITINFASKFKLYKSLVISISSMTVKNGPRLLTLRKGSRALKPSAWGNYSTSIWNTRPVNGCGARLTPLWIHRNLFFQLSRNRNLHGLGMSHGTTASLKPSFRPPWRVGDAMVGRGNAWWTTSKSGHPWPCQSYSQGPFAEKTGRVSLLNCPSCHLVKGLNWTELSCFSL